MSDATTSTERITRLTAVLHGGPADLPAAVREREVAADQEKVKIPWLGGHEHFERDPDAARNRGGVVVFRWTARTRVAE